MYNIMIESTCTVFLLLPTAHTHPQQDLSNKPPEFIEFLEGLGWIVNPVTHPGFAGKVRQVRSSGEDPGRPVGVSAQIPFRPFPYFADAMNEIAFVVPQLKPSCSNSAASLRSVESSDSGQDSSSLSNAPLDNPLSSQVGGMGNIEICLLQLLSDFK